MKKASIKADEGWWYGKEFRYFLAREKGANAENGILVSHINNEKITTSKLNVAAHFKRIDISHPDIIQYNNDLVYYMTVVLWYDFAWMLHVLKI